MVDSDSTAVITPCWNVTACATGCGTFFDFCRPVVTVVRDAHHQFLGGTIFTMFSMLRTNQSCGAIGPGAEVGPVEIVVHQDDGVDLRAQNTCSRSSSPPRAARPSASDFARAARAERS